MRNFHTVVLERLTKVESILITEPYEVGWADEAILFFHLQDLQLGATVTTSIHISVDGINWIEEGTKRGPLTEDGHYFVRVSQFGGWLRARFEMNGGEGAVTLTTQLALKG